MPTFSELWVILAVTLAILILVLITCYWSILTQREYRKSYGLKSAELATAENEHRRTTVQIIQTLGGLFAVLGAIVAIGTLMTTKHGQLSDRFSKAVESMHSDKLAVRAGAMYGLLHIAQESKGYRDDAVKIIRNYLRTASSMPKNLADRNECEEWEHEIEVFEAAINVLGQLASEVGKKERLDLQRIRPMCARLGKSDFRRCDLTEANLTYVDFTDADLGDALFIRAQLDRAVLQGATFDKADLQSASLRGANLRDVKFKNGVNLRGATLYDVQPDGEELTAILADTVGDCSTLLPDGVTRPQSWEPCKTVQSSAAIRKLD